ncbi:cilia- and flagella-associated protein 44 [Menidia menidia]
MSEERVTQSTSTESNEESVAEEKPKKPLPADLYYEYEDLHSRPSVTADSHIPENLLHLSHSFGYDSGRRANLKLLDDTTLMFIAGNLLVLLDVSTREQRYLRSCGGGGIGSITTHPTKKYFVVAEKGKNASIIVYEYPSLRPYRVLRGGTEWGYVSVDFSRDGDLLASVDSAPDYMLSLWDWRQEELMQSCKAVPQEVFRVSFSPFNPGLITSSGFGHIRFWKMGTTFTGLKLQGVMGYFGNTVASDIDGYVELPDGKVISGTEWGNLLLWDGNSVKVEITRKEGQKCHTGTVQPFTLEDGQLMTFGSDGVIRGWDFERINTASTESSRFELEPFNEMVVGHNVCLSFVTRSSTPDSFIWFAQDSNGAIWKLDLSFTNTASDPECLFSFHAGAIQGMDVSKKSHLMATTAMGHSVKVFDFLAKKELTSSRFSQGGTVLRWAPPLVDQSGLLLTGFEDGVVRLLELYNPQKLHVDTGRSVEADAKLCLKQAFKPHNAHVTALEFDRNGEILATGSADSTVFFFTAGEKYDPIGFIHVPGPVQALEWSPNSHSENKLLVLCRTGHVMEVACPDPEAQKQAKTFQLPELPSRTFRFRSIKSRIRRDEEIARRQAIKDKKKEERKKKKEEEEQEEEEEEEEEELPPIYIPDPPSPLCCGFYSQPGQFWLSMGGFDSGFLYHCKFSEDQDKDPKQRQDEPFDFLCITDADEDPIYTMTFSSDRQLLLCGMHSGAIRVYTLQPGDQSLASMQAFWALSVHDNHYGHLRHVRCSYDDLFVLTAGDDGNIFSFCLLPPEELQKSLQRKRAKIPSPRVGLQSDALALDIEDPSAYSLETAKQKLENDQLRREAELKVAETQKQLAELQKKFKQVLNNNQSLPEHVRLKPEELQLDRRFYEHTERLKAQKVMEVRRQMAWEQERCNIALRKLQERFKDSMETDLVTVVAIHTNHRVSMYRLLTAAKPLAGPQSTASQPDRDTEAAIERRKSRAEAGKDIHQIEEDEVLCPPVPQPAKVKLGDRQEERLKKASEKAEQARAKIEKRKQEWAQIYAEKPDEDYEDPEDVRAIQEAKDNVGDVIRAKNIRVNAEGKRQELIALEEKVRERQTEMNRRIVELRDAKLRLVSWLGAQAERLSRVQQRLPPHLHRPLPSLPVISLVETPEKRLQCSGATLEKYRLLREKKLGKKVGQGEREGGLSLLEQLEKEEMKERERKDEEKPGPLTSANIEEEKVEEEESEEGTAVKEGAELSDLVEELQREAEISLLHEQSCLLEQMEDATRRFDAELLKLRRQKVSLDCQLKLADLRLLTLSQEMLLLKQFEKKEGVLQEKLNECVQEEKSIMSKLEECNEELEVRKRDIAKLQERDKALTAAFQASLGENHPFEEYLTKVFKKKVVRVKKKEQGGGDEEAKDSDEDSEEDSDWDDDFDSETEAEGAALDDSICPPGCARALFENSLQLRERRLDLEELLVEERRSSDALKKESETLMKKWKVVKSSRQVVENQLELLDKEKLKKINELNIVVPFRLHQIKYVTEGCVPADLSEALVQDRSEMHRLQRRILQLDGEKLFQKDRCRQTSLQHVRLRHELKDLAARIQVLEAQCNELMMIKFGRLVDLEALQMVSGNRRLEELKWEKLLKEAAHAKEIKHWDAKVEEANGALMEVTRCNTEHLRMTTRLLEQKKELEFKLSARQSKMGRQQFQDHKRHVDQEAILKLQELVKRQSRQIETLNKEIQLLSSKGGHILPPDHTRLPPISPLPSPMGDMHTGKQRPFQGPKLTS